MTHNNRKWLTRSQTAIPITENAHSSFHNSISFSASVSQSKGPQIQDFFFLLKKKEKKSRIQTVNSRKRWGLSLSVSHVTELCTNTCKGVSVWFSSLEGGLLKTHFLIKPRKKVNLRQMGLAIRFREGQASLKILNKWLNKLPVYPCESWLDLNN